jgi:hypothetical protein
MVLKKGLDPSVVQVHGFVVSPDALLALGRLQAHLVPAIPMASTGWSIEGSSKVLAMHKSLLGATGDGDSG